MDIEQELAALRQMKVSQLRDRYMDAFGESTNTGNKSWLVKRIAWRLQFLAQGGISERAKQRAAELANDADIRSTPPKNKSTAAAGNKQTVVLVDSTDSRIPLPGSELSRDYKGKRVLVRVLPNGFEFEGKIFRSLTAVAKDITGQHCSGFAFFGLGGRK